MFGQGNMPPFGGAAGGFGGQRMLYIVHQNAISIYSQ